VKRFFDLPTIQAEGKMGFRGVTTNPPLCLQAIKLAPDMWAARIKEIAKQNPGFSVEDVYWEMYLDIVRKGAAMVLPVFKASGGKYGMVSCQVDPRWVRRPQDAGTGSRYRRHGRRERDGQDSRLQGGL
jgi:transaldolase